MKSISTRFPRTIWFLIMFVLIGFNLITTITPVKDDKEPAYINMNTNISRKLLRVPMSNKPPSPEGNGSKIVH
ncbi:hypothetical protein C5167_040424 [Papaver somniferum]|uniref:Uncharacterized protein n=1 Tax=Papaver somniferum TaxID=3469 RepID=A0A4Y7IF34_PAPSO|nr:hypothetical protein C5167_040424 [Papaver somniferum]